MDKAARGHGDTLAQTRRADLGARCPVTRASGKRSSAATSALNKTPAAQNEPRFAPDADMTCGSGKGQNGRQGIASEPSFLPALLDHAGTDQDRGQDPAATRTAAPAGFPGTDRAAGRKRRDHKKQEPSGERLLAKSTFVTSASIDNQMLNGLEEGGSRLKGRKTGNQPGAGCRPRLTATSGHGRGPSALNMIRSERRQLRVAGRHP